MEKGDIVYWLSDTERGHVYPCPQIRWGVVEEVYHTEVNITIYEPLDRKMLDGILLRDYVPDYRTRKLPKGWSYDTRLFEVTEAPLPEELATCLISDCAKLKEYIQKGYLVPAAENPHWYPQAVITKHGWHIEKDHDNRRITDVTLENFRVYESYADAREAVDSIERERERQAGLSVSEWWEEEVGGKVSFWASLIGKDPGSERVQKAREHLLGLPDAGDIDLRITGPGHQLQYRYAGKKKWICVEPPEA